MASGSGGGGFWNRWLGGGRGPLAQAVRRRLGLVGGAAALLTLVVAAAAGSLGWIGLPYTIEVPLATWPGYEYFYLAHRKGLAKPFGLQLRTRDYPYPQAIVHAYLRGELDVAQLTTVEAVDICHQQPKRCPVVVLILDESRGGDMVAARREFGSMRDLRGRRVAVTPSTLGPYVLSRALEREGMGLADVQVVPMPMGEMAGRLARREVEGAAFFPPFSDYALRVGLAAVVFDSSAIPGEIFDVLVVAPEVVLEHRRELVQLLRTWQAAHDYADRHPDEADQLMAFREKLSVARFRQAEQGLLYPNLRAQQALLAPGGVLDQNLAAVQRVQVALGLVREGAPLPRVDDEPLRQAVASMGAQ